MSDQSLDLSTVGNLAKREADQIAFRSMASGIMRMPPKVRVLSFPGSAWMWELALDEAFSQVKFDFQGLERNAQVYRKLSKYQTALPRRFHMSSSPMSFVEFSSAFRGRRSPFHIVYLDWMGSWSKDKKSDMDALFKSGMLAEGGLLLMTVSLRRGSLETIEEMQDISYDLPMTFYDSRGKDKNADTIKVRGIPHWVQERAADQDISLRPIMATVYYSSTGISGQTEPQLQLMFLREF